MFKKLIESIYKRCNGNLIYYDAMTGVYNRNYYEMVCREKYKNKEVQIYLIDMNKLKELNDNNGHEYGDNAIKYLCELLNENIKEKEIVRLGGDEFIIFTQEEIDMKKIKNKFENNYETGFSCGKYIKGNEEDFSKSVKQADINLYKDKQRG